MTSDLDMEGESPSELRRRRGFQIRMWVGSGLFVLTFFVSIFWAGYEQGGGLMNLFTDRSTDRVLLGHEIPTTWFQAVNSAFIFTLAPMFASQGCSGSWGRTASRRLAS